VGRTLLSAAFNIVSAFPARLDPCESVATVLIRGRARLQPCRSATNFDKAVLGSRRAPAPTWCVALQIPLPNHPDMMRKMSRSDISQSPHAYAIAADNATTRPTLGRHISE